MKKNERQQYRLLALTITESVKGSRVNITNNSKK